MDNYDRIMDLMGKENALLEQINSLQDILIVCESPTMQRLLEETMCDLEDEHLRVYHKRMVLEGRSSIWDDCFKW